MTDQTSGLPPSSTGSGGGSRGSSLASGAQARAGQVAHFMSGRGDVGLALGIIVILVVLILPMPTWMLDIGLAFSMTFSVMVLMTVLFTTRAMDLNSFPTILLIATLLRLALNLASTRLILAYGHEGPDAAGEVIEAFGGFIMQGNFVIGIIVFSILVMVNFIVITKGSGRIAEVAARFTLDAMPGKQMAIDADLSSGLIDEKEAKKLRKDLQRESEFMGSMDGAAKFVRGDAMAGLLITFINIIGGMLIGTLQHDLSLLEAADTYVRLTVGDGLVSNIPALMASIAAGMLVTKSGDDMSTDKELFGQLTGSPWALAMVAVLLLSLAVLPGVPFIPFMAMASVVGFLSFYYFREQDKEEKLKEERVKAKAAKADATPKEEPISSILAMDQVRLELGYALLALINAQGGQKLTDQIKGLRRQLAGEVGFVMPAVRIQDNLQLPSNTYVIRVKEIEAGRGEVRPGRLLCMDPRGETIRLPGEATVEPTFGLPAMWIAEDTREEALFKGYTVVDPQTVVTTHLTELIREHMPDLLSYAETQKLLDELSKQNQKLVADVIPNQITVNGLQRVLQRLLSERVSVRDLGAILEGVSEATAYTRNVNSITEHVRSRLARQISSDNTNDLGYIPIVTLSPGWEQAFADSIVGEGEDRQLAMAPSRLQEFIAAVRATFERHAMTGEAPVLLTSPGIRAYVRSIVERFRPTTMVMSQNEIHPKAKIKTLGQI